MNKDKYLPKPYYYLIITALIIFNLFIFKLLLQYPFFYHITDALKNIFFPFLISFIIVYIFHPVLYWFEKRFAIKTWVSTLILIIINATVLIVLINVILPLLGEQVLNLFLELPKYFDQSDSFLTDLQSKYAFLDNPKIMNSIISFKDSLSDHLGTYLVDFTINSLVYLVKSLWLMIMIPILVFIMMKDYGLIYDKLSKFLVRHRKDDWIQLLKNIDKKLGAYIRGQFMIMGYMFFGTFIPLTIFGLHNAFIFSIIVAVTNIIPFLGPYLGGIPLCIFAYFQSPHLLIVAILNILVMQQFDGNIGQPLVYGTQLNIHPLVVIIVMLTGSAFGGVIGLVISVPIYIVLHEVYVFFKPKIKQRLSK